MKKKLRIIYSYVITTLMVGVIFISNCANASDKGLWKADIEKNKIIVISDIHLGIDDSFTENVKNRDTLIDFLERVKSTKDIKELVIAGDFLDEWYLPMQYPGYTDSDSFYRKCIKNNQVVFDRLNEITEVGIKVVYVPGNHDMLLESPVLKDALPKVVEARDTKGLGRYVTGMRNEVVIEHGHRYDVWSAPDTITNAKLLASKKTILPAGYFYARYAASWVSEGKPKVVKNYPVIEPVTDRTNIDQIGAYAYYKTLFREFNRMTPNESFEEKIIDVQIAGFNGKYSIEDIFPILNSDGAICAPLLYPNPQRTWEQRQQLNNVTAPTTFLEAVSGAFDKDYFYNRANEEYLTKKFDIVVFGHTHVPTVYKNGKKIYLNSGTWIDYNSDYPELTCTFAVVKSGEKSEALLFEYRKNGLVKDITELVLNNK